MKGVFYSVTRATYLLSLNAVMLAVWFADQCTKHVDCSGVMWCVGVCMCVCYSKLVCPVFRLSELSGVHHNLKKQWSASERDASKKTASSTNNCIHK